MVNAGTFPFLASFIVFDISSKLLRFWPLEILIDLYIRNNLVVLSLNTSGAPLFQRGYRTEAGLAPLNEVVAACLLRMSGWDRKKPFLDPFCGSGTILVEAALLASGIPSNIERNYYAFKNLLNYDQDLWMSIYEKVNRNVSKLPCEIIGIDISDSMIIKARRNLRTFPFSINFSPRNQKEGQEVKQIIRAFKSSMAAKKNDKNSQGGQGGAFLSAPDVFQLRYLHNGSDHPFLNSFKICALTAMQVNYTNAGTYATYSDGTPVSIKMNLTFKELNPIYHEDYSTDNKVGGVGF